MVELALKVVRYLPNFRLAKLALFLVLMFLALNPNTRDWVIESSSEAFIAVTSFVGATLLVFYTLEKKNFNIAEYIKKNSKLEIPICAFLGIIPGCGGAIMVMSMYTRGIVSFSSVLATLISTMGDAAFILIASKPQAALIILPITLIMGIVTGYISLPFSDKIAPSIIPKKDSNMTLPINKIPTIFYKIWLYLLIPAVILGLINAFNLNIEIPLFGYDIIGVFALHCFDVMLSNVGL